MAEALEQLLRSEQLGNEIAKLADEEVSVQMLIEEDFSLTDLSPVIKLGPAKKLLRLVNQFKDKQQAAAGSAMDLPSNGSAAPPPSEQLEQQQQDVVMEVDSQSNLSQQAEEQSQDLTQTQNNSEMMVDEIAKVDDEDILAQIDKDNEEDNEESLPEESKAEESKAEESKIEESKGEEEKEEEDEDLPEKKDEIAEPTAIHSESQAALVLDDISDKEDGEEDEEDEKKESLNECHHRRSPTTANTTELFTVPVSPSGHIQESTGGDRSRSSSSDSGRAAGERRSRSRSRSPRSPRSRSRSHSRASSCSRSSSPHSVEKQPAPRLSPGNSPAQKRYDNLNRRIPTQTYRRSRSRSPHDNRRSRTRSRSRSPRRTTRRLSPPPPPPPARRRQTATNLTPTRNNSSNNSNQRRASVTFNTTTNAVRAHNWHSNGVTVCKCCHQDPRGNTCTAICYNYHFRNGCLNTKNCHYLHDLARGQLICVLFTAFPDQLTHITVEVDAPFKRSWSHKEDLSVAVRFPHNLRQRLSNGVYGITEKEYEAGTSFVNLLNIATIKSN